MRTIEPIPAKTLGTLTAHGAGWINSRAGHYRLMGWGTLEPWEEQAACHDTPIELWFGQELPFGKRGAGRTRSQTLQAKAICAACPVLEDCRQWALEFRMPFGVLGGLTERERLEIIEGKPLGRGTKLIKPSR